MDSSS